MADFDEWLWPASSDPDPRIEALKRLAKDAGLRPWHRWPDRLYIEAGFSLREILHMRGCAHIRSIGVG